VLLAAIAVAWAAPSIANAQASSLVVALPFDGNATDELLDSAYLSARAALVARGATVPERSTVRAALPVAPPTDRRGLVAFGRSMGGTHLLTGHVTPLTGQYNLELNLYELSTGRAARSTANVGLQEETEQIARMVADLFAPDAMQPTPEELAERDAERARREQAQREADEARRLEAERARAREAQARADEARRRAQAEAERRVTQRFAAGGVISVSLAGHLGGRLTAPASNRPPGAPAPTALAASLRTDALYAIAPSIGLELGAVVGVMTSPSVAALLGPTVRINLPTRGALPLRGSAGFAIGLFGNATGSQTSTLWMALDARAEYDLASTFSLFAGANLDVAPGALTNLSALVGARLRFGDPSPATP
jgi:hypothetical protein